MGGKIFLVISILILLNIGGPMSSMLNPTMVWPGEEWDVSTPEEQGMNSTKLVEMNQFLENENAVFDSILIIRNGYIVFEEYPARYSNTSRHVIYSVTKSFTSTLIGIANDLGYLEINQSVMEIFSDWTIANVDSQKESITIEHLLTMTSGLDWNEWDPQLPNDRALMESSDNWVQYTLGKEMVHEPGEHYEYSTGTSHLLSAIINITTGQSTLSFAEEHLFGPIGIQNPSWPEDPQGIHSGGNLLSMTPRDMARLGHLYLNDGLWDANQIISADYVNQSTETRRIIQPDTGYGWQWWSTPSRGSFEARGAFGQFIVVIPDWDIVVVVTDNGNTGGMLWPMIDNWIIPAAQDLDSAIAIDQIIPLVVVSVAAPIVIVSAVWLKRKQ